MLAPAAAVTAAAFALLTFARAATLEVYLASGLLGLGTGLAMPALATVIVSSVRQDETGAAAGINNVARTLGGALGGQVAAVLLVSGGYTEAFAVGLVAMLAAVAVGPLLRVGGPYSPVALQTAPAVRRTPTVERAP